MTQQDQRNIIGTIQGVRGSQQMLADEDQWRRNIEAFLGAQPDVGGPVECTEMQRPGTGAGSGNVLFSASADFGDGRQVRKFALRFRHPTSILGPYLCDIPAQFAVQKSVAAAGLPVPKPLWLDSSGAFLEYPGFAMEFVKGRVPPQNYFEAGVLAEEPPKRRREMMLNIMRMIARVHAIDWQENGLGFLKHRGRGATWLEKDLSWYLTAAADLRPDMMDLLRRVEAWLVANQPREQTCVLNHGDANPGNYVFQESGVGIVTVLDWEMACLNPREVDLAHCMIVNDWVSVGASLDGIPSNDELIAEYQNQAGCDLEYLDYFRVFALFRGTIIFRLAVRFLTPEQQEATRASWGWFEDQLLDRLRGEI